MPTYKTLQLYILRDLAKTFALSALALTGVIGLGGGVMNMIEIGDATPGQALTMIGVILPVAAALTLPVAALFAATSTYGRMSGDNEFVACRASGINIIVLFLPTLVVSVISGAATFVLFNFFIPGLLHNLDDLVGGDIAKNFEQRLARPRGLSLGRGLRVRADHVTADGETNRIVLTGVTFVEVGDDRWSRVGTAKRVVLDISRDDKGGTISGTLYDLSYYEAKSELAFLEAGVEVIPPNRFELALSANIKFLNLGELYDYRRRPEEWHEVVEKTDRLRLAVGRRIILDDVLEDWRADHELTFTDGGRTCTITAASGGQNLAGDVELLDATVVITTPNGSRRTWRAERAMFDITRGNDDHDRQLQIELFDARLDGTGENARKPRTSLDPLPIREELIELIAMLSQSELLSEARVSDSDPLIARRRGEVRDARGETLRRITGVIHERFAFTFSVFVLVVLGAALGIIFRGGHVVVAFMISFVPALVVIVGIVTGKQLAHNATTHSLGIAVIWSGIVLVAMIDAWTLTRVLRR